MPIKIASLFVEMRASLAKFQGEMNQMSGDMMRLGSKMQGIGTKLSFALSAPLTGIAGASLKMAAEFEAAMNKVSAKGDVFGAELKQLEQQAIQLGAATKFSATDAAKGMEELAAAGFKTTQIMAAAPAVLDLAAASNMSVADSAKVVADTIGQFSLKAQDATRVVDVMAAAANASQVEMDDLALSLKYVGPAAEAAGLSLEQTTAILAELGKAGIRGDTAGTTLRTGLVNLIAPSKKAAAALKEMGIETTDAAGKLKPLPALMDEFKAHVGDPDFIGNMKKIFDKTAMSGWIALVKKGGAELSDFNAVTANSAGAAKKMAETMNKGLAGTFEKMTGSIATLATNFGRALEPAAIRVMQVIDSLADRATSLVTWFQSLNPSVQTAAIIFGSLAAALGPVMLAVGGLVAGFGALVSPVLAMNVAIGAVAAGIAAFLVQNETVQTVISAVWGAVTSLFSDALSLIGSGFTALQTEIIQPVIDWFQANMPLIEQTVAVLTDHLKQKWAEFAQDMAPAVDAMTEAWGRVREATKLVWDAIVMVVKGGAQLVGEALQTLMLLITGQFTVSWTNVKDAVTEAARGMYEGVKTWLSDKLTAVLEAVKAKVQAVSDYFKSLYVDVVGSSYIPDMVDGIGRHMARLDSEMVSPAMKSIKTVGDGFNELAQTVSTAFSKMGESFGMSKGWADSLGKLAGVAAQYFSASGSSGGGGSAMGGSGGGGLGSLVNMAAQYFGGGGGGGTSGIGPVASGSQYGAMLQGGGKGGAYGMGGQSGWGAAAGAATELASIETKDYEFGSKGNEQKHKDEAHAIGMAVANYWTVGLASVFEKLVGRKKLEKISGVNTLFDAIFSENKETYARKAFDHWIEGALEDKNVSFYNKEGKLEKFSGNFETQKYTKNFSQPGWGPEGKAYDESASKGTFDALGKGLQKILGITEDVGGQIGFILSSELNHNIDNARILVDNLGISEQQMTDAFVQMGDEGSMSWHAVEVSLQGVSAAFGEGLAAQGAFAAGFDQIIDSGGDGKDAILAVKNAAFEAAEAGIKDFGAWRNQLLAAGKDADYVNALFGALQQRGMDSFQQIKDAGTREIGGVIADMQSMSPKLAGVWIPAQEAAQKYAETVAAIPNDSTKNMTLNVGANISAEAKQVLDMQGGQSSSATKFASGGVVQSATGFSMKGGRGLMGEAGPEAILPLTRVGGRLGVATQGADSRGGNTIVINAQGAGPGVENKIRDMIFEMEDRLTSQVIDQLVEARDRGAF